MTGLASVVGALSVVVGINLLLTLAVLRRLRLEQRTRVEAAGIDLPRIGTPAPAVSLETVDGETIDRDFYAGRSVVVGFFTADCPACERVKSEVQRRPLSEPFLALVQSSMLNGGDSGFAEQLAEAGAAVSLFEYGDGILETFGVRAFPTLLRVQNGMIVAAGFTVKDLEKSAKATDGNGHRSSVIAR